MAAGQRVTLPTGLVAAGAEDLRREVELRPLTGAHELLVQEAVAAQQPRVLITTMLLAACTEHLGEPAVEALCVGDREALLLHLRRAAFGERIDAIVACPRCREALDVELRASELLVSPADTASVTLEVALEADGARWRAMLRRVTGADQRAVLGAADPAAALLRRCVLELVRADGVAWPLEHLSADLAGRLEAELQNVDPQAEVRLDLRCPSCGHGFAAPFDPAGQLFAELAAEGEALLREVAALARAFHWREADILALPRARRRAYATLAVGR
jgi:hypothetical protein